VWDWGNSTYPSEPQLDPVGAESGKYRGWRGGCFKLDPVTGRVAFRNHSSVAKIELGLRVVRNP
jgi:formylglycine-generating enzyme required for sulfatase activity